MKKKKRMKKRVKKLGLQPNEFLEELGLSIEQYGTNFCNKKSKNWKRWQKQRKRYGFDDREVYNYEIIFVEQLYSHLKMYKKVATIIDMTYHKVPYQKKSGEIVELTQEEAIALICRKCEKYLKSDHFDWGKKIDRSIFSPRIMTLLGNLMPYMWW